MAYRHHRAPSFRSHVSMNSHMSKSISTTRSASMASLSVSGDGNFDEPTEQSQDFTVIGNAPLVDPDDISEDDEDDLNFKMTLHENNYPLALPRLCKLVQSTPGAIESIGGQPVTRFGFATVSQVKNGSKRGQRHRYLSLSNGKIRIYKDPTSSQGHVPEGYHDGEQIYGGELKKDSTYALQRVYGIRYSSDQAISFRMTLWTPKKSRRTASTTLKAPISMLSRLRNGSHHTLGRKTKTSFNDVMSDGGRSQELSRKLRKKNKKGNSSAFNLFRSPRNRLGKNKKTFQEEDVHDAPRQTQQSLRSKMTRKRKNETLKKAMTRSKTGTVDSEGFSRHDSVSEQQSRAHTNPPTSRAGSIQRSATMGTRMSMMSFDSFDPNGAGRPSAMDLGKGRSSYVSVHTMESHFLPPQQQEQQPKQSEKKPKERNLLMRDEFGNICEVEVLEIDFSFETTEQCQDWLRHILLELENRAKLFSSYVAMFAIDSGITSLENQEILLRKAVDLMTLARGVRDREVWRAREKLAQFLEDHRKLEDARLWFDLSYSLRAPTNILEMIEQCEFVTNRRSKKRNGTITPRRSFQSFGSFGSFIQLKATDLRLEPPQNKEQALRCLTLFLQQFRRGDAVLLADTIAKEMIDSLHYVDIARKLEAEYGRVPDGFEFYLIAASKTPIEKIQAQLAGLKEELKVLASRTMNDDSSI